jgi:diguanylate cyclase (GGDEF)-like protein
LALGCASAILIGLLDFLAPSEVILALLYLVPIVGVSWFVDETTGLIISLFCAVFIAYDSEFRTGYLFTEPIAAGLSLVTRSFFFLLTAILVGRLHATLRRSEQLAMTDDLTQVFNGRAFFEFLHKELLRSQRYRRALTVVYLDLDNFKSVNDSLGHQAGNRVLQEVVAVLKRSVRLADTVARIGGDEFAVLLPETDENAVRVMLPRLHDNLLQAMQTSGWPVTFSIGVLTCHQPECDSDEIFRRADGLMYAVKHGGKNGIRYDVMDVRG